MTYNDFEKEATQLHTKALNLMFRKNSSYTKENQAESPFHNFEKGIGMGAGNSDAQVAWSYMVKHLVALKDMVDQDEFDDVLNLEEKCKDIINYITIIYCMGINKALELGGDDHVQTSE